MGLLELLKVHGVFCQVREDMGINKNDDNNDINNNSKNCVIWMLVSDIRIIVIIVGINKNNDNNDNNNNNSKNCVIKMLVSDVQ